MRHCELNLFIILISFIPDVIMDRGCIKIGLAVNNLN